MKRAALLMENRLKYATPEIRMLTCHISKRFMLFRRAYNPASALGNSIFSPMGGIKSMGALMFSTPLSNRMTQTIGNSREMKKDEKATNDKVRRYDIFAPITCRTVKMIPATHTHLSERGIGLNAAPQICERRINRRFSETCCSLIPDGKLFCVS